MGAGRRAVGAIVEARLCDMMQARNVRVAGSEVHVASRAVSSGLRVDRMRGNWRHMGAWRRRLQLGKAGEQAETKTRGPRPVSRELPFAPKKDDRSHVLPQVRSTQLRYQFCWLFQQTVRQKFVSRRRDQ